MYYTNTFLIMFTQNMQLSFDRLHSLNILLKTLLFLITLYATCCYQTQSLCLKIDKHNFYAENTIQITFHKYIRSALVKSFYEISIIINRNSFFYYTLFDFTQLIVINKKE